MRRTLKVLSFAASLALLATAAGQQERQGEPPTGDPGRAVYGNCSGCHGHEGEGGFGPALAGNTALEDTQYVVERILHGSEGMPAFADTLSNERIAAVVTYVRTHWGNDMPAIEPSDVEEVRGSS